MIEITDRQLEIIESAGKILTSSGVSGLTIKKLALEMGFSEAALYRHFKSKEDILITMLKYLADDMEIRFEKIESTLPKEERFEAIFKTQMEFFQKNKYFVVAVFSDGLLEESVKINQQIYKIMQIKMKYLFPIIVENQKRGVFTNEISTEEVVHIVMGAFRLQMYKWRISHFEFNIEQAGNHLIQSVLKLIKTK